MPFRGYKECPACAVEVPRTAQRCPVCGYDFPRTGRLVRLTVLIVLLALVFPLLLIPLCQSPSPRPLHP